MKKILSIVLLLLFLLPNIGQAENNTSNNVCDENLPTPIVEIDQYDNYILVSWQKISHYDLQGYKVVISKEDSSPVYPANGYLAWITDRNVTSHTIDNSKEYRNGDFGKYLENGEDYYFSVTAVYACGEKVAGNVIKTSFLGTENDDDDSAYDDHDLNDGYDKPDTSNVEYPVPVVSAKSSEEGVLLSWNKINDDRFTGYKVVIAKETKNPKYPDHGYARYITNPNTTSYLLDNSSAYVRGDFGGYLKNGEDYYFSVTALYGTQRIAGNAIEAIYNGPDHISEKISEKDPLQEMEHKAELLSSDDGLGEILTELEELRNLVKEQQTEIDYLKSLVDDYRAITEEVKASLNNFITYGVDENTQKLGAGERAAVIYSYKSAFKKLPESEDEMADAIKIANGRWPSKTNEEAENRARAEFKKIYLRDANMENTNDNAAVTIMAYGLRQRAENRNLRSEEEGIKTFKYIYNKLPETTEEWNIMQAITYSGASR